MLIAPHISIIKRVEWTHNDNEKIVVRPEYKDSWTEEDQKLLENFNFEYPKAVKQFKKIEVID